jgi:hypothetical protein
VEVVVFGASMFGALLDREAEAAKPGSLASPPRISMLSGTGRCRSG